MLQIAILTIVLFLVATGYIKYAGRYRILDAVNDRSSHATPIARGGGLVIPLAMLCYAAVFRVFDGFVLGLLLVALVSFLDDVKGVANRWRLLVQFVAVSLMVGDVVGLSAVDALVVVSIIVILGTINAVNFMDGINGITVTFGLVMLATLIYLNRTISFVDEPLLQYATAGVLVFAFFNFRGKPRCFSGDVGSVSLGFLLTYVSVLLLIATESVAVLAIWTVYGVDSVMTILHRLIRKQNIFEAHRMHLYQYLANELGWPHLLVSTIYGLCQLAINVLVVIHLDGHGPSPEVFLVATLATAGLVYLLVRTWAIRKISGVPRGSTRES